MTELFQGPGWAVRVGHSLDVLRQMAAGSVQTIVTSPPYFGLRVYGTNPQVWGGDPSCAHEWALEEVKTSDSAPSEKSTLLGNGHVGGGPKMHVDRPAVLAGFCQRCNAWRGEYGAEPTPDLYVEHTVIIARELRRVLRDDGTLWWNLGSSYAPNWSSQRSKGGAGLKEEGRERWTHVEGYPPKSLIPIPWLVGIALQKDGWTLRNDCIWSKADDDGGTCMPFPAVDRFVPSHEYVLLFSKQRSYTFDWYAVAAGSKYGAHHAKYQGTYKRHKIELAQDLNAGTNGAQFQEGLRRPAVNTATRRARSVWTINVRPFKGAHFATFPAELAARCIQAGAPEGGACSQCGKARRRVVEKSPDADIEHQRANGGDVNGNYSGQAVKSYESAKAQNASDVKRRVLAGQKLVQGAHFEAGCDCVGASSVPCVVLDPFSGSGTTVAASVVLGRTGIGIELLEANAAMTESRVADLAERGFKPSRKDDTTAVAEEAS